MTPQIDDGPRMPFGRYGREPSGEPGKLSPPALMQSECIAGDAGIPRNRFAAGADQRTHAAIGQSNRAHPSSAGVSAVAVALIRAAAGIMFPTRHLY